MDKKILLIADDEEMNRKIISKFLKNNFEIIEAENGRAALDILQERHVDVLLLDIIMPEVDGLEVLKSMRSEMKFNHIGVLVATSTKEKTERTALSLGADDVVSKPYDPLVIRKRLENILAMKMVNEQKDLLQDENMEMYIQEKMTEVYRQTEEVAHNIQQYADIINANVSNPKLVEEVSTNIKEEAAKLTTMFVKE